MENIERIIINKNRGWRGLAELRCYDSAHNNIHTMVFSFSEPMWGDLHRGLIVTQDDTYWYVIDFSTDTFTLPVGQRSILIKNFNGRVNRVVRYAKTSAVTSCEVGHVSAIRNFVKNRNNHTQSDWNCIGIRVVPTI